MFIIITYRNENSSAKLRLCQISQIVCLIKLHVFILIFYIKRYYESLISALPKNSLQWPQTKLTIISFITESPLMVSYYLFQLRDRISALPK